MQKLHAQAVWPTRLPTAMCWSNDVNEPEHMGRGRDTDERKLYVYVDESGDNRLDSSLPGASHLFHLVAVVVDGTQKEAAESALADISRIYFGGGEIRSQHVAANHQRRLRIWQAINKISFGYYGYIVNKDRVERDCGLQWKKTFYKNTRKRMYQRITGATCASVSIFSHRIGSQEYMDSFGPYLSNIVTPPQTLDLFPLKTHAFVSSSECPLVQLADFVAGSLGYCFDADRTGEQTSVEMRRAVMANNLGIEPWPYVRVSEHGLDDTDESDSLIRNNLSDRVTAYLDQLLQSDSQDDGMRECVLSKLLSARLYDDRCLFGDYLMEHLVDAGYPKLNKQFFTAKVIGEMRNSGIIISGTSQGYRLALSMSDIEDYLSHNKGVTFPMYSRIARARNTVKAVTSGRVDILARHTALRRLVELYEEIQLEDATAAVVPEEDDSIDA